MVPSCVARPVSALDNMTLRYMYKSRYRIEPLFLRVDRETLHRFLRVQEFIQTIRGV